MAHWRFTHQTKAAATVLPEKRRNEIATNWVKRPWTKRDETLVETRKISNL